MSGGEKRKLSFILGLLSPAPVLLLDETENHVDENGLEIAAKLIQETTKIVFVITHRKDAFENFGVINLVDGKATVTKENNTPQVAIKESKQTSRKLNVEAIAKLSKFGKLNLSFTGIILLLMLFLTIHFTVLLDIKLTTFTQTDDYQYNSDTALLIRPPQKNNYFETFGDESWLEITPLTFDQSIYDKLKASEYVKSVIPVSDQNVVSTLFEVDGNSYQIDPSKTSVDDYSPTSTVYSKSMLTALPKLADSTLVKGEYPKDDSNQVAISSSLASEYKLDVSDTFVLPLIDDDGNSISKQFEVSGIIDTFGGEDRIQEAYVTNSQFSKDRNLILHPNLINQFTANSMYSENDVMNLYDENTNYYYEFYIETNNQEDLEKLSEQIYNYDPHIDMISSVSYKYNTLAKYSRQEFISTLWKMIEIISISAFLFSLVYVVYIYREKRRVYDVIIHYGYNADDVKKIIKHLNCKLMSFCAILAIVGFIDILLFKTIEIKMLYMVFIGMFVYFSIVTILLTTVWRKYVFKNN